MSIVLSTLFVHASFGASTGITQIAYGALAEPDCIVERECYFTSVRVMVQTMQRLSLRVVSRLVLLRLAIT